MNITDAIQKNSGISSDKTDAKANKKAEVAQTAQGAAANSGNVTLSAMSAQLQSLEASVAVDNVYDAEKVEAIKLAISNGQFQIDAGKIADGLINTVRDMLGPQNKQA